MATRGFTLIGTVGKGPATIEIYGDIGRLEAQLHRFERHGVPKAKARAINKIGNKTRTKLKQKIAKDHNLAAKFVTGHIRTRGATRRRLSYELMATGSRIPISKVKRFNGFSAQKPLGVVINTGTGRRLIAGAFVARMASGHIGVFKRRNKSRPRVKSRSSKGRIEYPELPIRELTMPSIPHLLTARKTIGEGFDFFERHFPRAYFAQLEHEIARAKR